MKKLISATSLFALMLAAPVMAQDAAQSEMKKGEPTMEQTQPAPQTKDTMDPASGTSEAEKSMKGTELTEPAERSDAIRSTEADKPAADADTSITNAMGTWRASKLIGKQVLNASNESVGDINDFVLDSEGNLQHVLVGVGGFLGLGEKVVALKPDALTFQRDENGNIVVTTSATKPSLEAATPWKDNSAK